LHVGWRNYLEPGIYSKAGCPTNLYSSVPGRISVERAKELRNVAVMF
jgi:hypothetical protein